MADFPSLKARKMLAILMRKPLSYTIVSQVGSHRKLSSANYPNLEFSFHEKATVPGFVVRKIFVNDIGLTAQEALNLI